MFGKELPCPALVTLECVKAPREDAGSQLAGRSSHVSNCRNLPCDNIHVVGLDRGTCWWRRSACRHNPSSGGREVGIRTR